MRKTLIIGDGFFILILIRGLLFRGYVRDKGILADYLRVHGSEVVNMLMSEDNYEQDIEAQDFELCEKLYQEYDIE